MGTTRFTYRAYIAIGHDAAANSDPQCRCLEQSDQGQTHYAHIIKVAMFKAYFM
jgi:hypothetical protein